MMIKSRGIRHIAVLLGLILMAQMAFPAYAEISADQTENADIDITEEISLETGTITARVVCVSSLDSSETPLAGVGLSLYRVASAAVSDGTIQYIPVDVLSGYEKFFNEDFSSDDVANTASEIVSQTDLSSCLVSVLTTAENGSVEFEGLSAGIYLIDQTGALDGYVSTTPYLIKLPEIEENDLFWDYDLMLTTQETTGTAEEWDLSKAGTLTVNAGYVSTGTDRTPVVGVEFTVYQVATVTLSGGNVYYVAVDALKTYESQMNSATTTDSYSELAAELAAVIAGDDTLAGQLKIGTQESGSDGNAVFESMMSGMYLVVQTNTVSGYQAISPFLACLPMTSEDGSGWDYNIQALPKLGKTSTGGGSSSSGGHSSGGSGGSSSGSGSGGPGSGSSSGNPADTGSPSGDLYEIVTDSPLSPLLPQTGLRRSIVSFLAIGGIFFITLGWKLGGSKQ
ncbi:MAG: hypothetical protein LUD07_03995 [Clostridiales bacterium]|nr:hypothetical protein [Clostridiales bacterium]